VTGRPADGHLQDLAVLRRVRDRIDHEYAQPLDVEALARGAHMSWRGISAEKRRSPSHRYRDRMGITIQASFLAGDAEVVQEPIDQPYGIRDCAFRDPAGNMVRISEIG